jgi:hypothetical protein
MTDSINARTPNDTDTNDLDETADADAGRIGPLKAIRSACLRCQGTSNGVEACASVVCPLHSMRFGHRPDMDANDLSTPVRPIELGKTLGDILGHHRQRRTAIRAQCLDCVGYERREIAACTTWKCALYPFRLGPSHPADFESVATRRSLWNRIGHEAYVRAMNELLCSGVEDEAAA